jgi:membrane protein YdbS with pleckstrin-like domain
MAQEKAQQNTTTAPEPDFTWRWHLKVLSIIYISLAVLYTIMLWALAEPEFKWSSQAVNLVILYAIPAVLWTIRTVLLQREARLKSQTPPA